MSTSTSPGRHDLAIHTNLAAEEVDAVDGKPEALALAHSHPGGEHDEGPVSVGHGGDQRLDLPHVEGEDLGVVALGEGDADTRRRRDEAVADCRFEDGRDPPVDELHRARRQAMRELLDPALDLAAADAGELPATERGVGVQAEVALDLSGRTGPVNLGGTPFLGVVAEHCPAASRVDVEPVGQVAADGVEEPLGVALAGELAGPLGAAGVLPPPGPVPPVGSLVDARHRPSSLSVRADLGPVSVLN
jgi:hypothetical protein